MRKACEDTLAAEERAPLNLGNDHDRISDQWPDAGEESRPPGGTAEHRGRSSLVFAIILSLFAAAALAMHAARQGLLRQNLTAQADRGDSEVVELRDANSQAHRALLATHETRSLSQRLLQRHLGRIPVRLPREANLSLSQLPYSGGRENAGNSSREKPSIFDSVARDIASETRARAIADLARQGGLIDVPARIPGPSACAQGHEDCEWMVNSARPVNVRSDRSFNAPILAVEPPGAIVVGRTTNGWLRLAGGRGFMALEADMYTLMEPRNNIWYEKIVAGSCSALGRYPILHRGSCEIAAQTLGLTGVGPYDDPMHVIEDNASPVPEGCYMDATGILRINLEPVNIGNGVIGSLQPICATLPYQSTRTSTTTTTTSSTMTTTTTTSITTSTTRTNGFPSLLCFSYMRPHTSEQQLITEQLKRNIGIFACDAYIVVSEEKIRLGTDLYGEDVVTWKNPPPSNQMGDLSQQGVTTNSWLNTVTFMVAFNTIMSDSEGRVWEKDFFAKVDPDAVFFPDRLRNHVKPHVGQPVFYLNCQRGSQGELYGALEVYSKQAMMMYHTGSHRCKTELQWQGWGEDLFFSRCMQQLGVQGVADFTLVGDDRCMRAPCTDSWRAAFHPFKDFGSWIQCWHASGQ